MKRFAAQRYWYVQVDCANGAVKKGTHTTTEKIVQRVVNGAAATWFTSAEMEQEDATDG